MKKKMEVLAALLAVALVLLPVIVSADTGKPDSTFTPNAVIIFKDKQLEMAVRKLIGKNEGQIKSSDVNKIVELKIDNLDIMSLEGLQYLKNLMYLHLNSNGVSNLSPLSSLKKLEYLSANSNKIIDITPLSGLKKLMGVELGHNQISNIEALSNLEALKKIYIFGNMISSISPLSGLKKLKELDIGGNKLSDISELRKMRGLETLKLEFNNISNFEPVKRLTSLRTLYIKNNVDSGFHQDYSPLSEIYDTLQDKDFILFSVDYESMHNRNDSIKIKFQKSPLNRSIDIESPGNWKIGKYDGSGDKGDCNIPLNLNGAVFHYDAPGKTLTITLNESFDNLTYLEPGSFVNVQCLPSISDSKGANGVTVIASDVFKPETKSPEIASAWEKLDSTTFRISYSETLTAYVKGIFNPNEVSKPYMYIYRGQDGEECGPHNGIGSVDVDESGRTITIHLVRDILSGEVLEMRTSLVDVAGNSVQQCSYTE